MLQDHAAEYRQKAEECRLEALAARSVDDRTAWLEMAQEWMRLAEDAEAELAALKTVLDEGQSLPQP
jgi:hypothetical protein